MGIDVYLVDISFLSLLNLFIYFCETSFYFVYTGLECSVTQVGLKITIILLPHQVLIISNMSP